MGASPGAVSVWKRRRPRKFLHKFEPIPPPLCGWDGARLLGGGVRYSMERP